MVVKRNPDQTRSKLLDAAFHEIYRNGFRSASVDAILADTGVTKGALYHHFPSKAALGYAVVEEVIGRHVIERWVLPLEGADDAIGALIEILRSACPEWGPVACEVGCPLNNLAQEMSPIDEGFRQRVHAIYDRWRGSIAAGLHRDQSEGLVRTDIDPEKTAHFIVASIEGAAGLAKNAHDPQVLTACLESLEQYLRGLRVAANAA